MCGLVTLYNPAGLKPDEARWRVARDLLAHRGPDDSGEFHTREVWMGFRRLSILDLSQAGHQPMLGGDGKVALVFNGQIYNHRDLRRDLEGLSYSFRSECDTETVLAAYLAWGTKAFARLRGMWAIIIWDARTGTLTVSRDRYGIKPLYVHSGREMVFASEIKAILHLVPETRSYHLPALQRYIARAWLDHLPETLFNGIQQVPAGSILQWRDGRQVHNERFWTPPTPTRQRTDPQEFLDVLADAADRHLQSDVPVAAALSGGLDSSTIVSILARKLGKGHQLTAFSVRAPDIVDESPWIDRTVALTGVKHEYIDIAAADYESAIDEMMLRHDEPTFSAGQVNQYMMRREVRRRGFKVLLVGDGADEILGGYAKCIPAFLASLLADGRCADLRETLRGATELTGRSIVQMIERQRLFRENGIGRRTVQEFRMGSELFADDAAPDDRTLFPELVHAQLPRLADGVDFFRELLDRISVDFPIVLRNEDRNGMAHSIEVRPVFMDHTVIESAWTYPYEMFMAGGLNKALMRRAVAGIVAPEVLENRRKFVRPGNPTTLVYDRLGDRIADMLRTQQQAPELWARGLAARFEVDRRSRDSEAAIVWMRFYQLQRWLALCLDERASEDQAVNA